MTRKLEYIEIDVDYCSRVYGVAPCTAAIGTTGSKKCYNTLRTCQDRSNFNNTPVTLRFAIDTGYNPKSIDATPSLVGVSISPSVISLGDGIGIRSSLNATFRDHLDSDAGIGQDKYTADRSFDPYNTGTYWGKFRERQPFLRGRPLRYIVGNLGDELAEMETRSFVIDSFNGPHLDGSFSIVAKDALKLADDDRALAPRASTGTLAGAIAIGATTATLQPVGIGAAEYAASGLLALGGKEIVSFTRVGDVITITRGQRGTVAQTHVAGSRVQTVLSYTGADLAFIVRDLLVNFASVPASLINTANWTAETAAFLQRVFTADIAEPTGVRTLIAELMEQAAAAVWVDDLSNEIRLQVLRAVPPSALNFNDNNIVAGSLRLDDQPEKRISRALVYYARTNPLKQMNETDNYQSLFVNVDVAAETDNGNAVIRQINSRWIPEFGASIAQRVTEIFLARFATAPRKIQFDLFRGEGQSIPMLGDQINVSSIVLQDDEGFSQSVPAQVVSVQPSSSMVRIMSEELRFTGIITDNPNERTIVIDNNTFEFNLRTVHDSLFPVITNPAGISLSVVVNEGVTIGSNTLGVPAFVSGNWPNLPAITLTVNGTIQGRGGLGGGGSGTLSQAIAAGEPGSTALASTVAMTVVNEGQILGGGGGGGAAGFASLFNFPVPGGGGSGAVVGLAGPYGGPLSSNGFSFFPARLGLSTAGGFGGRALFGTPSGINGVLDGGRGGAPGAPGEGGTRRINTTAPLIAAPASSPGAGGAAIVGASLLTIGGGGTIAGAQTG